MQFLHFQKFIIEEQDLGTDASEEDVFADRFFPSLVFQLAPCLQTCLLSMKLPCVESPAIFSVVASHTLFHSYYWWHMDALQHTYSSPPELWYYMWDQIVSTKFVAQGQGMSSSSQEMLPEAATEGPSKFTSFKLHTVKCSFIVLSQATMRKNTA